MVVSVSWEVWPRCFASVWTQPSAGVYFQVSSVPSSLWRVNWTKVSSPFSPLIWSHCRGMPPFPSGIQGTGSS